MKTSKNSINFIKSTLMTLPIPQKGTLTFCDTKERDLSLYVTSTGYKSFFVQKRIHGKPKRIILGRFPDMTIEQARKKAQQIKARIANGEDPLEEKQKLSKELNFGEAYQIYMERHVQVENKPRSQGDIASRFRKILPSWSDRKLSCITRYDVQELHNKIGKNNGKTEANRVINYLCALYNKMISWGLWGGTNPAANISKFKEHKRDRFVLMDELPKLIDSLGQEPNHDARDFFLMCLFTGARRTNVLSMRWEDIDFNLGEWRIPDTKNGDPIRVPLIRQALEILNDRAHIKGITPWVFPSLKSKTGHFVEPKSAWKRILERAGLGNLRIHDLRRTNGSYQAIAGSSLAVIGKSLGHKSTQSTAIYARLSNDPVRISMEKAFNFDLWK